MANRPQFMEGDWVFYFNPGHQWHMMLLQITKIIPMTINNPGGYELSYGRRFIVAKANEVLHRRDSQVPSHILQPNVHSSLDIANGQELDEIGQLLGLPRVTDFGGYPETDTHYRARLQYVHSKIHSPTTDWQHAGISPKKEASHEGHEVVENWAGGNKFFYCRKCKVEVFKNEA